MACSFTGKVQNDKGKRMVDLIAKLFDRPDYYGECDRCHQEDVLIILPDEPGEFAYCEKCWRETLSQKALELWGN